MNASFIATLGLLLITASPGHAGKTITSKKVDLGVLDQSPYRFNGAILTEDARGSGFCAGDSRLIFTAAHVVFGESAWVPPPLWYPAVHDDKATAVKPVRTRGYLRWASYADLATSQGKNAPATFGRDVALAFSFKNVIKGKPAKINFEGKNDLQRNSRCMITGYPAQNPYLDEDIEGYFMHRTRPARVDFKNYSGNALQATLITTGPGNSGGPVWIGSNQSGWKASGVLVGGLPSECIVHAFSDDTRTLFRSTLKTLNYQSYGVVGDMGLDASSLFFKINKPTKIPDGVHRWTEFALNINSFEDHATVNNAALSLNISTKHRGDLQVILTSPRGNSALIHNEQGAGKDDLVIKSKDLSEFFEGAVVNGRWVLRVQDRLKGDTAVFHSMQLEISATKKETP